MDTQAVLGLVILVSLLGYGECNPLEIHLSTVSSFKVGQNVEVKLTFTNRGNKNLSLYHLGTPLEGMISDCFRVTRNKLAIHYDGPLYKRSAINFQSEGSTLKSNESLSIEVDLSSAYNVGLKGSYTATLLTKVFFHFGDRVIRSAQVQSPSVKFVVGGKEAGGILTSGQKHRLQWGDYTVEFGSSKNMSGRLGAAKSVQFMGSYDSVDASEANDAWNRAYSKVTASISDMSGNPSHYVKWFGVSPTSTPWSGTFSTVKKAMEQEQFGLYFKPLDCKRGVFAYTYVNSHIIYLCGGYVDAQAYGYDSKFGTLVHEMTHAVVGTKDLAYGVDNCLYLAKTNPSQAVMNADNYEYFVETL